MRMTFFDNDFVIVSQVFVFSNNHIGWYSFVVIQHNIL